MTTLNPRPLRRASLFAAVFGIAALSLTLVVPSSVRAQDNAAAPAAKGAKKAKGAKRGGGNNPAAAAFEAVKPTADQKSKFEALEAKYMADQASLSGEADQKAARQKRAELTTKYHADIEAILTPDQAKQFKEEFAIASVMGSLRPLGLSQEEVEKIKPVIKDTAVNIQATRDDSSLKGKERREKLDGLFTELKGKVKPILTSEQQTQLDAINFQQGGGRRRNAAGGGAGAATPPANP